MGRSAKKSAVITVCLLSHHPLFLEQFGRVLAESNFQVRLYSVATGEGRLTWMPLPEADVFVLDALNNPLANGILIGRIRDRFPAATVAAIAERFSEVNAFPLLQAGVHALLTYRQAMRDLGRALAAVSAGEYWVPRTVLGRFVHSLLRSRRNVRVMRGTGRLSRREREVLDGLMENLSNKEIAQRLHIAERTAKFHVSKLLAKFGVRRRADLILLGYQKDDAA